MDIQEKIKAFPDTAGIYLMKDKTGRILYVGKAGSLKKRVGSYFQKPPTVKTQALLEHTADIDYLCTASSAQALLLEQALIKRYQPYYNAALKDDKSYPYVKIALQGSHPYLAITRGKKQDGAQYYGPYTNVKLLKRAIKALRAVFPFCSCLKLPRKPCLYYHLKLCPGLCAHAAGRPAAVENLRQLGLFLQGRHAELLGELKEKMYAAAKSQAYETAAHLRDRLLALSETIAQGRQSKPQDLIVGLQQALGLAKAPYRIEAFDISELSGQYMAGALVSFLGGWPDKQHYRRFRIKTVRRIDDYAMLREVLQRRFAPRNRSRMPPVPDLVVIDGGSGHLHTAEAEFRKLGLRRLAVVALAKREETLYLAGAKTLRLPRDSKALHLLQRIRDEAHRFALSYHRRLRLRDGPRLRDVVHSNRDTVSEPIGTMYPVRAIR